MTRSPGWHLAAWSNELGRGPLGVLVGAGPLVLFRGPDGRPRALEDRCPHRGLPLSLGSCRRGTLSCLYHGWAFDGTGALLEVPTSLDEPLPRVAVPAYAAAEADGYVWVAAGSAPPGPPPDLGLRGRSWRRWRLVEDAPAADVATRLAGHGTWHAPDRLEVCDGPTRLIVHLVPAGPGRTRVELLAGLPAWRTRVRDVPAAAGWPAMLLNN